MPLPPPSCSTKLRFAETAKCRPIERIGSEEFNLFELREGEESHSAHEVSSEDDFEVPIKSEDGGAPVTHYPSTALEERFKRQCAFFTPPTRYSPAAVASMSSSRRQRHERQKKEYDEKVMEFLAETDSLTLPSLLTQTQFSQHQWNLYYGDSLSIPQGKTRFASDVEIIPATVRRSPRLAAIQPRVASTPSLRRSARLAAKPRKHYL
jgi:hypothetical protein